MQVQEELNSPACFADIKFSNDGKMIMAVVDGKVCFEQRSLPSCAFWVQGFDVDEVACWVRT